MKNRFLGFVLTLISHLPHEETHFHIHTVLIQQQNKKIDQKKIIKTGGQTDTV